MVRMSQGWESFAEGLRSAMTVEQALVVEQLRSGGLTWRAVAEEFYDRFPGELYGMELRGSQGAGMLLCKVAGTLLGRPVD